MDTNSEDNMITELSPELENSLLNSPTKEFSNNDIMTMLQTIKKSTDTSTATINNYIQKNDGRVIKLEKNVSTNKNAIESLTERMDRFEQLAMQSSIILELQKQSALKNNIVIIGIPSKPNENLHSLLKSIASCMSIKLDLPTKVISIYRIANSKTHSIVVKFTSFDTKLAFILNKYKKPITLHDVLGNTVNNNKKPIFITHRLTPYFAKLMQQSRDMVKDGRLKASWISANGLTVRFTDDKIVDSIISSEQLESLTSNTKGASKKRLFNTSPTEITPTGRGKIQRVYKKKTNNTAANSTRHTQKKQQES